MPDNDMTIKDQVVKDNIVRACASVYPVDLWVIDKDGKATATRSCRFVLAQHPEKALWAALAWANIAGEVSPVQVLSGWVRDIQRLDSRSIELVLDTDERIRARPQGGCACGSRLRNWAPWGSSVQLASIPRPAVTA